MLINYSQHDAFLTASGISMSNLQLIFSSVLGILIFSWFIYQLIRLRNSFEEGVLSDVRFLFSVLRATALAILMIALISYLMTT